MGQNGSKRVKIRPQWPKLCKKWIEIGKIGQNRSKQGKQWGQNGAKQVKMGQHRSKWVKMKSKWSQNRVKTGQNMGHNGSKWVKKGQNRTTMAKQCKNGSKQGQK